MKNPIFLIFCLISVLFGCIPPENRKNFNVSVDLSDPVVQRIFEFQDKHLNDSLSKYLTHEDLNYRFLAARAYGSTQDSSALEKLGRLLRDESEDVRVAAAFAIGQIGSVRGERVLLGGFDKSDSLLAHRHSNAAILESIGKCGQVESLKNITGISTYLPSDTTLLEGQMLAIYRFSLRQITLPEGTAKMVKYSCDPKISDNVRLVAANYLRRTKTIQLDTAATRNICAQFQQENNPEIKTCLATALGRTGSNIAFSTLIPALSVETDYRTKIEVIRSLKNFAPDTARSIASNAVHDKNNHVSAAASEYFIENGRTLDADWYWRLGRDTSINWFTRINLFKASNKFLGFQRPESRDYINYWLKSQFEKMNNSDEKAACLSAMGEFGWNLRVIHEKGMSSNKAVVRTAAVSALASIANNPNFYSFFGEASSSIRRELNYYLHEGIQSGDVGMIATAAETLLDSKLDFQKIIDSAQVMGLSNALAKLKMPQDYETYVSLAKTVQKFIGSNPKKPELKWNHPIDWTTLSGLGSIPKAVFTTSFGEFSIQLMPEAAPASVSNFIKLANQNFFNEKTFHRVVSNFVIQGGCPRGDGYGSLDYSIRSEFSSLKYDSEGWVGMASAGKDTEGTQFFITNSSAFHLDGKYTIFGKVVSGMDIIHKIQVGTQILKVKIVK
jgi:cyclophilin family peptidyl-prolyl cis-trans isomerase/HEAT repeat protein